MAKKVAKKITKKVVKKQSVSQTAETAADVPVKKVSRVNRTGASAGRTARKVTKKAPARAALSETTKPKRLKKPTSRETGTNERKGTKRGRSAAKDSQTSATNTSFETRAGHEKRQTGLSLKLKFALPISVFLLLLIAIWTLMISSKMSETMVNNIKLDGANAARLLALHAKDVLQANEYSAAGVPGEDFDFKPFFGKWMAERENWLKPMEWYPVRGKKVKNHLMNALIQNSSEKTIAALNPTAGTIKGVIQDRVNVRGSMEVVDEKIVKVSSGIFETGKGQTFSYYKFSSPVYDDRGEEMGTASILLSAHIIGEMKHELLVFSAIMGVIAVLVGTGIAFWLASVVTKPVQSLTKDVQIVARGNLKHKTIPHSNDEVGLLAYEFNNMTKLLRKAQDRELEQHRLEHELSIATDIQKNLLPKGIPKVDGMDFFAIYHPAKEVGGDYYDYITIGPDHVGCMVADVSGKGIPGSMVMTQTRMLLHMESRDNTSASDTLRMVNRTLSQEIRKGMFVTAMYSIINVRDKSMLLCSAGHNPLVVYRKASRKMELHNPNGIALGFDKGTIFDRTIKEQKLTFDPGDIAIMYTDGVVEAMNIKKEEYGEKRFISLLGKLINHSAKDMVNAIYEDLENYRGKAEQHDDITISIVKFL